MRKIKTLRNLKTPRWVSTPVEEDAAARRIAGTKHRNTPEAQRKAAAYGKLYRQRVDVRARKREQHRRWRAKVAIKLLAGDKNCHLGPRPWDKGQECNPGHLPLDF